MCDKDEPATEHVPGGDKSPQQEIADSAIEQAKDIAEAERQTGVDGRVKVDDVMGGPDDLRDPGQMVEDIKKDLNDSGDNGGYDGSGTY